MHYVDSRWIARVAIAVFIVVAVGMGVASAATIPDVTHVTSNTSEQRLASVSGTTIAWQDLRTPLANVYMYDVVTRAEVPVAPFAAAQLDPDVSGDVIVWEDTRAGNGDIYAYDLATGDEERITSLPSAQNDPAISGDWVVWVDQRNVNQDIYAFNLATGVERRITTNTANQQDPSISGDIVVWTDYRNATPDAYMYDLSTGHEKRLTSANANQDFPAVWGDLVVWQDARDGTYQIYGYDTGTGVTTKLTTNGADHYYPEVSRDRVVWDDRRNAGTRPDVYGLDVKTGETLDVSAEIIPEFEPATDGNKVVWSDGRDGNLNIYMAEYPTQVVRAEGTNRFRTSVEISKSHPTFSSSYAILATGRAFPDALSASGLAGALRAPLLLVDTDSVPSAVMDELARKDVQHVILVGGAEAITEQVSDYVENAGYDVERIGGATRYATSQLIAERIKTITGSRFSKTAIVARGDDFADALAASPVAYSRKLPVLLTKTDSLPSATSGVLKELDIETAVITGGTAAVNSTVASSVDSILKSNGGSASVRWAGVDRYATCAAVARGAIERKWVSAGFVGIATGLDFPDALCGGAACGEEYGVLLLAKPSTLPGAAQAFIDDYSAGVGRIEAFGGTAVLEDGVLEMADGIVN